MPVNLLVNARPVVVVGAGRVAARKIEPLLDLGAAVTVVAPNANDDVKAWAAAARLTLHERPFAPADLDGAWLAFTATDDPEVNAAVYAAGEERRIWVNSADDPANCSLTLMSVIRRSDLVVTVGSGGRSPVRRSWTRGGRSRSRSGLRPGWLRICVHGLKCRKDVLTRPKSTIREL